MNKDLPVGPLQKENRVDGEGADRGVGSQPDEEQKKTDLATLLKHNKLTVTLT